MSVMSQETGPLRDGRGTPKFRHEMIAAVLHVDADAGLRVLVRRRTRAPFSGRWGLPSGALETDELLDDSLRRHLRERTGLSGLSHLEQLETRGAPDRDPADRTIATAYLCLCSEPEPVLPEAEWLPVSEAVDEVMAFDGEEFTIAQLRDTYVAVLGYPVTATNLRRILQRRGQLEPTGTTAAPGSAGGRPAALFRFTTRTLQVTDPSAVLRP